MSGDADKVQQLTEDHVDVNSQNEVYVYMYNCVWLGGTVIVTITVQKGETALHLAAAHGHINVVQLLTGANADLNLQDKVLYMWGIDLWNILPLTSSNLSPFLPCPIS